MPEIHLSREISEAPYSGGPEWHNDCLLLSMCPFCCRRSHVLGSHIYQIVSNCRREGYVRTHVQPSCAHLVSHLLLVTLPGEKLYKTPPLILYSMSYSYAP